MIHPSGRQGQRPPDTMDPGVEGREGAEGVEGVVGVEVGGFRADTGRLEQALQTKQSDSQNPTLISDLFSAEKGTSKAQVSGTPAWLMGKEVMEEVRHQSANGVNYAH